MTWAKTAFGDMTDAEVRQEIRKHHDEHGNRLYEVDDEAAFERSVARDSEINVLTYQLWRENCEGLRRIGINADAYEAAGPTLFGLHDWEHPRRTRVVKLPDVIKHDAEPAGLRRPCGTVIEVR
jgi:hypothetical protein